MVCDTGPGGGDVNMARELADRCLLTRGQRVFKSLPFVILIFTHKKNLPEKDAIPTDNTPAWRLAAELHYRLNVKSCKPNPSCCASFLLRIT
jgi:hypothetical protein